MVLRHTRNGNPGQLFKEYLIQTMKPILVCSCIIIKGNNWQRRTPHAAHCLFPTKWDDAVQWWRCPQSDHPRPFAAVFSHKCHNLLHIIKKKSFFSFNALTFLLLFFWLLCPSCLLSVTIVFNRFLLCMAHAIGRYIAWPTKNQQHLLACPHFQLLHAHKTSHYIIFNSIKVSLSLFIWHLFKLKNAKYGKR